MCYSFNSNTINNFKVLTFNRYYEKSTFIATAAFAFVLLSNNATAQKFPDLDKVLWTLLRFLLIIKFRIN
jgi:hypothetical protein